MLGPPGEGVKTRPGTTAGYLTTEDTEDTEAAFPIVRGREG
jgi:hypothetical protein